MASHEIYQTSKDCERLFLAILRTVGAEYQPIVQVLYEQFVQWASYLGVFAAERMSLDARLMHSASVRDLVLQLLRIAHRNLERGVYDPVSSLDILPDIADFEPQCSH